MTVEELCKAARVGFGLASDGDPYIVIPSGSPHAYRPSLLWTCERKHMDDECVRAHWWLHLGPDGVPIMYPTPAWDDERERWEFERTVELVTYAIVEARP